MYNSAMVDQLKEMLRREPFVPFRIVTSSGDRYEVIDPASVAVAESYLFYCFPKSDRSAHIRLNQLVALEDAQPTTH